jgi:hypothetical protein
MTDNTNQDNVVLHEVFPGVQTLPYWWMIITIVNTRNHFTEGLNPKYFCFQTAL